MVKFKYIVCLVFIVQFGNGLLLNNEKEAAKAGVIIDAETCSGNNYHEEYSEECNKDNNPNDLSSYTSVPQCCGDLAYPSIGNCYGKDDQHQSYEIDNVHVCHQLPNGEQFLKIDFGCPDKCTLERSIILDKDKTYVKTKNGSYVIKENGHEFDKFCLSYNCEYEDGWKLAADICKCPNEDSLKTKENELKDMNINNISSCCDQNDIFTKTGNKYTCEAKMNTSIPVKKVFKCRDKSKYNQNETRGKELVQDRLSKTNSNNNLSCVDVLSHETILNISMLTCDPICNGHTPCFRYCCPKGEDWHGGECKKSTSDIPDREKAYDVLKSLTDDNKQYATWNEECDAETESKDQLTCGGVDILPEGSLKISDGNVILSYEKFCISRQIPSNRKGHFFFQACVPKKNQKTKLTFYPYILCISAAFLLLTVIIYLLFPPLINHYTKVMMNFSISLFFAFLVLIAAQKPDWFLSKAEGATRSANWPFTICVSLALLNQYFFLAAFTWMTIMSYEIFTQLKGLSYGKTERGIKYQLAVGYGVPFLIGLITFIVENAAPMCASYRPKFGHKECLFHGGIDKFIWFLGPILIMLLMNTGMFLYVFMTIFRTSFVSELTTGSNRKEKMDKACLYLRLFLGMGITWYFEIISWAIPGEQEWYFTDILNIFQGVYVFFIFVCKRNVLKVVLKKRDKLYSTVRRNTGDSGTRTRLKMMSETSRDGHDKTDAFTENVTLSFRFSHQPDDDETKV